MPAVDVSVPGTSGNGGSVIFNAYQLTFYSPSVIAANSSATTGNGGMVQLTTASANPLVLATNGLTISANGSGSGIGGIVQITNAVAAAPVAPATESYIDVNQLVSVTPGTGTFEGSIEINGVTCQQYPYSPGQANWPTAYWDCTGQNSVVYPTVPETAADLPPVPTVNVVNGTLYSAGTQLYAMNSLADWNNFFGTNPAYTTTADLGETVYDPNTSYIASAVFATYDGNGTTNQQVAEATAFQLGRAFDGANGSLSQSAAFDTAVSNDFSPSGTINSTPCATVFNSSVCAEYSGDSNSQIFFELFSNGVQPTNQVLLANAVALNQGLPYTTALFAQSEGYLTQINQFTALAVNPAVSCSTPDESGAYPQNYLWYCVTNGIYEQAAATALSNLGANAKTQLTSTQGNHLVFVFANIGDFYSYLNVTTTNPKPSYTYYPSQPVLSGYTYPNSYNQSVVIENVATANGGVPSGLPETVDHEVGHQLDYIYGGSGPTSGFLNTPSHFASQNGYAHQFKVTGLKVTIATVGTVHAGDTMTMTFLNGSPELAKGSESVTYTVKSTDTADTIAAAFVSAINSDQRLMDGTIAASGTSGSPTFSVSSVYSTVYTNSTSAGSNEEFFYFSNYDWQGFITQSPPYGPEPQCAQASPPTGPYVFVVNGISQLDSAGKYICSSLQPITVTGPVTQTGSLTVAVTDLNIQNSTHTTTVTYLVTANSLDTIAAGLAAAITTQLQNINITASSTGNVVYISSGSIVSGLVSPADGQVTFYAVNAIDGATETLTLGTYQPGLGQTLSNLYVKYVGPGGKPLNNLVLQNAWPYYFTEHAPFPNLWNELFAEETAMSAGANNTTNATPDTYLVNQFLCSGAGNQGVVFSIESTGSLPSPNVNTPCY